jgi:hypothetical protein
VAEEVYRLSVFLENYLMMKEHNSNPAKTFTMGINHFMDLTKDEFKAMYLNRLRESEVNK